jgi:ribulose 1,5-bisphosphate carboxylase large subunit-like protein
VIDERYGASLAQDILKQRLNELEQVIDLLELAAAVLVHLAVARQDMKLFEQFDRLLGADLVSFGGHSGAALGQVASNVRQPTETRKQSRQFTQKRKDAGSGAQERFMH